MRFEAKELGDAATLVSDKAFLSANAAHLLEEMPEGWSGWLGELRKSAFDTAQRRKRNISL